VVSGQINPDWDCVHANHMSTSSKADNLICSFKPLTIFNRPDTIVKHWRPRRLFKFMQLMNVLGFKISPAKPRQRFANKAEARNDLWEAWHLVIDVVVYG
jgi:hypothetical protein